MGSVHYNGASSGFSSYSPSEEYYHYRDQNMPPTASRPPADGFTDNGHPSATRTSVSDSHFDILDWHPAYQSCQRYFLDHAQYEPASQAVCALINIRLPFQWQQNPVTSSAVPNSSFHSSTYPRSAADIHSPNQARGPTPPHPSSIFVSPIPYIRRLVVTGFDRPAILHGFFGDDFARGIMPLVECERRNYLFAAKHGGWRSCKKQYDQGSGGGAGCGDESVPFMKPLDGVSGEELAGAEKAWSAWLAMEDWMVGPRAPGDGQDDGQQQTQSQQQAQSHGQHQHQHQAMDGQGHSRSGATMRRHDMVDG